MRQCISRKYSRSLQLYAKTTAVQRTSTLYFMNHFRSVRPGCNKEISDGTPSLLRTAQLNSLTKFWNMPLNFSMPGTLRGQGGVNFWPKIDFGIFTLNVSSGNAQLQKLAFEWFPNLQTPFYGSCQGKSTLIFNCRTLLHVSTLYHPESVQIFIIYHWVLHEFM